MHFEGLYLVGVVDDLGQVKVDVAMVVDLGLNGLARDVSFLGPQRLAMPVLLVLNVGEAPP